MIHSARVKSTVYGSVLSESPSVRFVRFQSGNSKSFVSLAGAPKETTCIFLGQLPVGFNANQVAAFVNHLTGRPSVVSYARGGNKCCCFVDVLRSDVQRLLSFSKSILLDVDGAWCPTSVAEVEASKHALRKALDSVKGQRMTTSEAIGVPTDTVAIQVSHARTRVGERKVPVPWPPRYSVYAGYQLTRPPPPLAPLQQQESVFASAVLQQVLHDAYQLGVHHARCFRA